MSIQERLDSSFRKHWRTPKYSCHTILQTSTESLLGYTIGWLSSTHFETATAATRGNSSMSC